MPQMTPVVLQDTADNQIYHSFVPRDSKDGIVTMVEHSGTPIGDRRITFGRSVTAQGRHKTTIKFVYPVVQNATVNGVNVPTVVRTAYCNLEISVDGTSTEAERREISLAVAHLFSTANRSALLEKYLFDLEGLY